MKNIKRLIKRIIYNTFGYKNEKRSDLVLKIKNGDICIDIGANVGNYSIALARDAKKVYAFEPNPKTFEILKKNTEPYKNILCINKAVGDKTEVKEFYVTYQSGLSGFGDTKRGDVMEKIKVDCVVLDDFFKGTVDFIKVDVEGFEGGVLKGCEKILKSQKPKLYVELSEQNYGVLGFDVNEVKRFLYDLGYKIELREGQNFLFI